MFRSYGLRTHIWNNNLKSLLLMAGFPVLLGLLFFALALLMVGFGAGTSVTEDGDLTVAPEAFGFGAEQAVALLIPASPYLLAGTLVWFVVAYFGHQAIIDMSTGAHAVTRQEEPALWNLLENLCISRGITMPTLRIIESPALNAFATGLDAQQYSITVTRGLMQALNERELEAVLAHELTHVRNKDVQLLVIAVIFVGIFSFVGELVFRNIWRGNLNRGSRSRRSGGDGAAGAAIVVALAIIAIAWGLALVIRFAISRSREFIADAGAVELTKDADAMASALRKVAGNATISNAPEELRAFFLENETAGLASLFASHPPINARIEALERYAGAQLVEG